MNIPAALRAAARLVTSALLCAGFFLLAPAPSLHAQNSSTVRAASLALIGRTVLTEEDHKLFERLYAEAVKDIKVSYALLTYETSRKAYQENQRKLPPDRHPAVSTAYRDATAAALSAVREAMLVIDPAAAPALLAKLDKKAAKFKNEGEDDTDSETGNRAAVTPIKDVPGLPRVLLIGDSISIGYTLQVRANLAGKANVHRIPANGGATEVGLAKIDGWLGTGKWDVIHFNFGLHDAKYASATEQRASREVYLQQLQQLIDRMKATGAKLIFATTTPVPEMLQYGKAKNNRVFDSIPERNALAVELMKKNDVAVDDLYTLIANGPAGLGRDHDVHFTPEGYTVLAKAVADSVEAQLPKR